MEEENNRQKESIEEILADLNNLLNKMPSILADIKIPEPQPIEFYKPEKEEGQLNTVAEPLAEKKHMETEIEIQKPAEKIVESSDAVKIPADSGTDILSAERIGGSEPEFITGEAATPTPTGFGGQDSQTVEDKEKIEINKQNIKELAATLSLEEQQTKLENLYDQTKSFSVPDIDDLFKIAEESISGGSDKDIPQEKSPDITTMRTDELATADKEAVEISAQEGKMNLNENPKDEDIFQQQNDEQQEKKHQEEILDEGFEPEKTINMEDLKEFEKVLQDSFPESQESEPQNVQPITEVASAEEKSLEVPPVGAIVDGLSEQQPQVEIKSDIILEIPGTVTPEHTVPEIQHLQVSAESGEDKTLMIEPLEIQKRPALESQIPSSSESEEEKTVVFEPGSIQIEEVQPALTPVEGQVREQAAPMPTIYSGQGTHQDFGDKTIMVSEEALMTPRTMSNADLSSLISRKPPEHIPSERIKSVGFLYSMGEEKMCAELLQKIDSICSKSQTKPMFVKRAFVQVFEPDIKGNYILEVVNQTQGMGLICVGNIPQENIYEVENVFNSSNVFFRHINQENFNHASVVNLVADLIIL